MTYSDNMLSISCSVQNVAHTDYTNTDYTNQMFVEHTKDYGIV